MSMFRNGCIALVGAAVGSNALAAISTTEVETAISSATTSAESVAPKIIAGAAVLMAVGLIVSLIRR